MKSFYKILIGLGLVSIPFIAAASYTGTWVGTSTTTPIIWTQAVNGTYPAAQAPYFTATSTTGTSTFNGSITQPNSAASVSLASGAIEFSKTPSVMAMMSISTLTGAVNSRGNGNFTGYLEAGNGLKNDATYTDYFSSNGSDGQVLTSSGGGTRTVWVATSSLGISSGEPLYIAASSTLLRSPNSTTTTFAITSLSNTLLGVDGSGNVVASSAPVSTNYWTLNGANLYNNSGTNVGIGTTTPSTTLTVQGTTTIAGPISISGSTTMSSLPDGLLKSTSGAIGVDTSTYYKSGDSATFANVKDNGLTASTLIYSNGLKLITSLPTTTYPTAGELAYVKGVTSDIQTQLNGKQASGSYLTDAPSNGTTYGRLNGTWSATGGGGGTPGGSNEQVQFNASSAFGGDSGLVYSTTTKTLGVDKIKGITDAKNYIEYTNDGSVKIGDINGNYGTTSLTINQASSSITDTLWNDGFATYSFNIAKETLLGADLVTLSAGGPLPFAIKGGLYITDNNASVFPKPTLLMASDDLAWNWTLYLDDYNGANTGTFQFRDINNAPVLSLVNSDAIETTGRELVGIDPAYEDGHTTLQVGGAIRLGDYTAIVTPVEGMQAWDYTNHHPVYYDGSNWISY